MASELYEVFGLLRYSPTLACPPSLEGKKVVLKSKDGFISQIATEAACLSSRIRGIIVDAGVEGQISLPLKQATLTKVIEYLNYHQTKPLAEIDTPLKGADLTDNGVASWDSKFMAVDKAMLFDLILAASVLGIDSLFYLAGAKAALMVMDKPEAKLLKEFKMKDDFPEEEAEEAQSEYREAWAKRLKWSDEETETLAATTLAASSALTVGMLGAAAKEDLLDAETQDAPRGAPSTDQADDLGGMGAELGGMGGELGFDDGMGSELGMGGELGEVVDGVFAQSVPPPGEGGSAVDAQSFRHAAWRVVVLQRWHALEHAPEVVRGDRELLFAAVLQSQGKALCYASPRLKRDRRLVLEAVKHSGAALNEADPQLVRDRDFILQCLLASGEALQHADSSFREDRDLILEAAKLGRGAALRGAADSLKQDADFVIQLLGYDPEAYQYADKALQKRRDFALAAARRHGLTLKYMAHVFQADRQIVANAVRSYPEAVAYSHTSCRRDLNMSMDWDTDSQTVGDLLKTSWKGDYREPPPHLGPWMSLYVEDDKLMVKYQGPPVNYNHHKILQFSASNVMTANMGQSNYIASNSFLDKLPFFERPEREAVTLMWGAVGGIGMRLKAFGSQDMLAATPEAWTTIDDARYILRVTVQYTGIPEWYNTQMYDPASRAMFLSLTAGYGTGGGWMPGESADVLAAKSPEREAGMAGKHGLLEEDKRDQQKEVQTNLAPPTPLAGWPDLTGAAMTVGVASAGGGTFAEGARVMLVGLKAKNGLMGTLVKRQGSGRWKIRLDGNNGLASLKEENFMPVGLAAPQLPPVPFPAAPVPAAAVPAAAAATAAPVAPRAKQEKEQREHFQIVGSWSNWSEPQEMTWERSGRCYKFRLRLAYRIESFQILLGSSDSCLYPATETSGAPDTSYPVDGPEERRRCRGLHWTIGDHPQDQGCTGAQYDVRLHLGSNGKPECVSWRRVGGAVAQKTE